MMSPPAFWQFGGVRWPALLLAPLAQITTLATARRVARAGYTAPIPVICCGNAGVGGAGKTTLVLDLCARLLARDVRVHLLTRGYGGTARGPLRVDTAVHDAAGVGDEALLLAAAAPTWLGRDRAATARLAVADGAEILIMDDGLQNPTLAKTASLLVIDGTSGFGNGRVLPAGPLREPVATAASRCAACVLIGEDRTDAVSHLPPDLPVLPARLVPGPEITVFKNVRALAFAGIGRPEKFFAMLDINGVHVVERRPFPDHHRFRAAELARLRTSAGRLHARPVTTPKDFVRIPTAERAGISAIGVSLSWTGAGDIERWLDGVLNGTAAVTPR